MPQLISAAAVFSNPSGHVPKSCDAKEKKKKALCCYSNHPALPFSATQKRSREISYPQKAAVMETLGCRWMQQGPSAHAIFGLSGFIILPTFKGKGSTSLH